MVGSHAALTHATKGQGYGGQVGQGVIKGPTTKGNGVQDVVQVFFLLAKEVEGQGVGVEVNNLLAVFQVVNS